ncbi:MAG: transglutaminase domain-containing protein [Acidobacteriota bacterium]|nr:MAG: transglutaminase domain-containing protein [Acidobacteriota bacterium]
MVSLAAALALGEDAKPVDPGQAERDFAFVYEAEIAAQPEGAGPVDVFVPLAASDDSQDILRYLVTASVPGREKTEARYGNRFWHGHVDRSDGRPITVRVNYAVQRRRVQKRLPEAPDKSALAAWKREKPALFLIPNRRVPVSDPLLDKVRAELPKTGPSPLARARAIYDYVVDNMEYKKEGEGWGHGDALWACTKRYGNCTDFHALFTSLARAEGIPTRFEIGFPIPENQASGKISTYHCWVQVFLPGVGWFPVDASEAWKHKKRRTLYFGTQPADRILFTTGRDLELGKGHTTGPLNYFIHPHVEVAGKRLEEVTTRLHYAEHPKPKPFGKQPGTGNVGKRRRRERKAP